MLIDERRRRNQDADEIRPMQAAHDANSDEADDREHMCGACDAECPARPVGDGEGVQPLTAVELLILCTVHRVERSNPEGDGETEHDHRRGDLPRHRNPAARRRHRDRDAEEEMYPARHALEERVDEKGQRGDWQEIDANGMQLQYRKYKHKEAHAYKDERLPFAHASLHHRAVREAGLLPVIFQIGEIVEDERRRPRRRDGKDDPAEVARARMPIRSEQCRHERERQREHRMMKGGVVRVRANPFDQSVQSSPNSFQRAVTRALISSLIVISSGHSRACPSDGHVLVASMPSFEPHCAIGEE